MLRWHGGWTYIPSTLSSIDFEHRWTPPPDGFSIYYKDRTHSAESTHLGDVVPDTAVPPGLRGKDRHLPFEFVPAGDPDLQMPLTETLLRCGMLSPQFSGQTYRNLAFGPQHRRIALLTDANALAHGVVHSLCHSFRDRIAILAIPGLVRYHRHRFADNLNGMSREPITTASDGSPNARRAAERRRKALSFRSMAVGMSRTQVFAEDLGIAIEEIGETTGFSIGNLNQSELTAVEDHLILQALQSHQTRLPRGFDLRIVTSDIEFARSVTLTLGIVPVLAQLPGLPDRVYSARFDVLGRRMLRATAAGLCWELTHQFSSLQLKDRGGHPLGELDLYWPHASIEDWRSQSLLVAGFTEPESGAARVTQVVEAPVAAAASRAEGVPPGPEPASMASLLRACDLVGSAARSLDALAAGLDVTPKTARLVVFNARAAGFVLIIEDQVTAQAPLFDLLEHWKAFDLDKMEADLERIMAYRRFVATLGELGQVDKRVPPPALADMGKRRHEVYCTWAVACGVAYDAGDVLLYGGKSPTAEDLFGTLRTVLLQHGPPGTPVPVGPVLDACSRALQCSPWRLEGLLDGALASGGPRVEGHQAAGQGRFRPQRLAPAYGAPHRPTLYYLDADFKVNGRPVKTLVLREDAAP